MPDQLTQEMITRRLRELLDEPSSVQKILLPRVEPFELEGEDKPVPVVVPHPPQFQPEPQVVGKPAADALSYMMKIAPALQGRVNKVGMGPNSDTMAMLDSQNKRFKHNYSQYDLPGLTLLGLTNLGTGNVYISPRTLNPNLPKDERTLPVMAHEVTHAAGHGPEKLPDEASNLVMQLLNRTK